MWEHDHVITHRHNIVCGHKIGLKYVWCIQDKKNKKQENKVNNLRKIAPTNRSLPPWVEIQGAFGSNNNVQAIFIFRIRGVPGRKYCQHASLSLPRNHGHYSRFGSRFPISNNANLRFALFACRRRLRGWRRCFSCSAYREPSVLPSGSPPMIVFGDRWEVALVTFREGCIYSVVQYPGTKPGCFESYSGRCAGTIQRSSVYTG